MTPGSAGLPLQQPTKHCENSRFGDSDHRLTIREVFDELNLSFYAVQSMLIEDLKMRRMSAKFVPKLLSDQPKQHRLDVSQDLINRAKSHPDSLNRVMTGNQS
ncbi:UNVERIFIED_CONTAM: hypothetical protein RMT77_019010 [Armadillidium vulgare]